MIRRILPLLLALLGVAAGAFGGDVLRARTSAPVPGQPAAADDAEAATGAEGAETPTLSEAPSADGEADSLEKTGAKLASFSFPQQFFVPLVRGGTVQGMMILSLSIETAEDQQEAVFKKENQLRDALLRQLMIHANTGGFDGNFTAEAHTALLRGALLASARKVAGDAVLQVLIGDITKQDGRT
ncbi:hypothetical protein DRW48_01620 [Paracoccus suum]|uniref:Flagellar basal body-associated protein FliL n=1 Tax=Paracoccus suum TaxID=2259340 RepID=A0A344PGR5_9RHOB|nr:hypothetical protein [Paracoccus suum]AXC48570.1 hypothetical protein DRW48_01620 [Paracoccus suum]